MEAQDFMSEMEALQDLQDPIDLGCTVCKDTYFEYRSFRVDHLMKRHYYAVSNYKLKEKLTCQICDESVIGLSEFLSHQADHHPEFFYYGTPKPGIKGFVRRKFRKIDLSQLKPNQKPIQIVKDQDGLLICPVCSEKFVSMCNLIPHMKKEQMERIKRQASLKRAKLRKRQMKAKECQYCGLVLHRQTFFDRHLFYEHPVISGKDPVLEGIMCEKCGKYFYDQKDLDKHASITHGDGNRICDKCGESFVNPYLLRAHMNKHRLKEKDRTVKCDECSTVLKNSHLQMHKKTKHQDLSLRTCRVCLNVFANAAELYKHYVKEHPNDPCPVQIDNKYVHQCEICGQIFASQAAHWTHLKLTHKIKREYSSLDANRCNQSQVCDFCQEQFRDLKELIEHVVNVHPEENWSPPMFQFQLRCEKCSFKVGSTILYHRHLKYNHHKFLDPHMQLGHYLTEGV